MFCPCNDLSDEQDDQPKTAAQNIGNISNLFGAYRYLLFLLLEKSLTITHSS